MTDEAVQTFASVWDALEETPEAATTMRLRSELMNAVRAAIESWGVTPAQAATRLGVTQPRLGDLLRGRIDRFSLEVLIEMVERAGMRISLDVSKAA